MFARTMTGSKHLLIAALGGATLAATSSTAWSAPWFDTNFDEYPVTLPEGDYADLEEASGGVWTRIDANFIEVVASDTDPTDHVARLGPDYYGSTPYMIADPAAFPADKVISLDFQIGRVGHVGSGGRIGISGRRQSDGTQILAYVGIYDITETDADVFISLTGDGSRYARFNIPHSELTSNPANLTLTLDGDQVTSVLTWEGVLTTPFVSTATATLLDDGAVTLYGYRYGEGGPTPFVADVTRFTVSPVPEPSTLALALLGGLAAWRRPRRGAAA